MICLQSDHPPVRRVTRQPANVNRSSPQQSKAAPQVTQKTKFALCFLCLFDGLRTPSIRRLVRKPRTICKKPLLTFDPSFYAPSSQQALQNIYVRHMGCPCSITVDPSVQTVLNQLKEYGTSIPPQRLLIHYYGHGCYAPSADGCIFFFSDDRARYKPLKIINLIHSCGCPLAFIFDCPAAAVLAPHLKAQSQPNQGQQGQSQSQGSDTFAFFACAADETLPLSTDAPMDLFSSCLLTPYDTAIWWHMQRHSTVYDQPRLPSEENGEFLYGFLHALLDAIGFESQSAEVYEKYTADSTLSSLFKGFVLAQRVMASFNIHSSAIPEVNLMAYHPLWNAWDLAIDFCITLPTEQATGMLYNLCIETFESFSSAGIFPILSYFLKTPSLSEIAGQNLLEFIDTSEEAAASAARSNLPKVINSMDKPSEACLLILAKLATFERTISSNYSYSSNTANSFAPNNTSPAGLQQQPPISLAMSKKTENVKAGILNILITVAKSSAAQSYGKITQVCIDHPIDCAPYSALLLGMLVEKGGRMLTLHGYAEKFTPLLESEREDFRAAAVYCIGASNDPIALEKVPKMASDSSPFVRAQVAYSVAAMMKAMSSSSLSSSKEMLAEILKNLEKDEADNVKKAAASFASMSAQNSAPANSRLGGGAFGQPTMIGAQKEAGDVNIPIIQDLLDSVKEPGFVKRYNSNIFMFKSSV